MSRLETSVKPPVPQSIVGESAANILLQGFTLASKTLLLFGLARFLTPDALGYFGIVLVTLSLSLYLVGLDFYAFNTREILRQPAEVAKFSRDQMVLHGSTYFFLLPLLLSLFVLDVLPWSYALLFYPLLILDHIAQEVQRLLITLTKSVQAGVVFFLRGGVWVWPVLLAMAIDPATRNVETVLIGWIAGVTAALLISAFWLRDLPWHAALATRTNWDWLRRGVFVSIPFLVASLSFRGIMSVDRFALLHFSGAAAVGVYTFYAGVRNAIQSILDMGVVAVLRPRVVSAHQAGDVSEYRALMRRMTAWTWGVTVVLCVLAAVAIFPLLYVVGDPIYGRYLPAYWVMLAVTLVASIADLPHTKLYARHQDSAIVVSSVMGLLVTVFANLLLVPAYDLVGAAVATLLGCGVMGILKVWFARAEAVP